MTSHRFWVWLALALAYLFAVALAFSALFAYWVESAKRKAARLQLARYWHWPACACSLVSESGPLVHIDARCLQWTAVMRRRIEQQRAERKTARVVARAEKSLPVN